MLQARDWTIRKVKKAKIEVQRAGEKRDKCKTVLTSPSLARPVKERCINRERERESAGVNASVSSRLT